jgi:hypothetical protein
MPTQIRGNRSLRSTQGEAASLLQLPENPPLTSWPREARHTSGGGLVLGRPPTFIIEHLFDRVTPEDLATGQVQFHLLVSGQIHREVDGIILIVQLHFVMLRRQRRGGMTKAENRAAARAYRQQKMREMAQRIRDERAAADLVELDRLRRYLIFKSESERPREPLLSAIDDYVEALTGDRNKLHDHGHSSIG